MKLTLLRHVESISNKNNSADSRINAGLSEKGRKDARELVNKLKKFNINLIIVSPLKRTLDTLKPFLNSLESKPKIITSDLTVERDLGKFTGSPMGAFQEYCEENNLDKVSQKPDKGESIEDVYKRAKEFLDYLKKNFDNKIILVCGHKNFLSCLEIAVKNLSIKDYYSYKPLSPGEFREFDL